MTMKNWQQDVQTWALSRDLVPITGAGVSRNFELPDRDLTVERLLDWLVKHDNADWASAAKKEQDTLLKVFRITRRIRQRIRGAKGTTFSQALRECLYDGIMNSKEGEYWLECCFQLSLICNRYVTFNWDNLFESYVTMCHDPPTLIRSLKQSLVWNPRCSLSSAIECIHLHGFLPYAVKSTSIMMELPLVFDLISYVEEYAGFINQLSVNLLGVMANHHCIFLGLSMEDPNLLRLIKMAYELRGSPAKSCWAVALGNIHQDLAVILRNWGVHAPDDFRVCANKKSYLLIPQSMLECLPSGGQQFDQMPDSFDITKHLRM